MALDWNEPSTYPEWIFMDKYLPITKILPSRQVPVSQTLIAIARSPLLVEVRRSGSGITEAQHTLLAIGVK